MNLLNKLKNTFLGATARNEDILAARQSMDRIYMAISVLDQKSIALQEKYPEIRKNIHDLYDDVIKIEPSVSVRAGKFEQAIAQDITKVSTECDKVFASNDEKALASEVANLARSIRERQNADSPEESR